MLAGRSNPRRRIVPPGNCGTPSITLDEEKDEKTVDDWLDVDGEEVVELKVHTCDDDVAEGCDVVVAVEEEADVSVLSVEDSVLVV